MKLLKYMLCASMCMSFGVAHAEWEPLGAMEKPIVLDNMAISGVVYNGDRDIDNAIALVAIRDFNKYNQWRYYMTASDCIIGRGVLKVARSSESENGSYIPLKFDLLNYQSDFAHLTAILICKQLSTAEKFIPSDDLKVRRNLQSAVRAVENHSQ